MKYAELERKLKAAGCYEVSKNGKSNHPKWYSPITGKVFPSVIIEARKFAEGR